MENPFVHVPWAVGGAMVTLVIVAHVAMLRAAVIRRRRSRQHRPARWQVFRLYVGPLQVAVAFGMRTQALASPRTGRGAVPLPFPPVGTEARRHLS